MFISDDILEDDHSAVGNLYEITHENPSLSSKLVNPTCLVRWRATIKSVSSYILGTLCVLACPTALSGVELSPWYPRIFELQAQANYLYQSYSRVASSHGSYSHKANDQFLNLNLGGAYYDWYAEADVILADTRQRNFGLDSLYLSGRYQLMDDVSLADPVSMIVSAFVGKATNVAMHDISSFHHGRVETGVYLSVGKEFDCRQFWVWRGWGSIGLGVADSGSPWLAGSLNIEKNHLDRHQLRATLEGLFGFGGNSLHPHKTFHGYGPIAHRSLDLGLSYSYRWDSGLKISLVYANRVYARNFPEKANRFVLNILYPFSL